MRDELKEIYYKIDPCPEVKLRNTCKKLADGFVDEVLLVVANHLRKELDA